LDLDALTAIVALVVPAGAALASYATLRERVSRHDRSIEDFGRRIGQLEKSAAVVDSELSRPHFVGGKPP
jgi:hypothetical protein